MPLKQHENIAVFYKRLPTYNPQGIIRVDKTMKPKKHGGGKIILR